MIRYPTMKRKGWPSRVLHLLTYSHSFKNTPTFPTQLLLAIGLLSCLSWMALHVFRSLCPLPRESLRRAPDQTSALQESAAKELRGEEARRYLEQSGEGKSLAAAVKAGRYSINKVDRASLSREANAYVSFNPAHSLQAEFTGGRVRVQSDTGRKWQMSLGLKGYGYGKRMLRVTSGDMKAHGNRVEISKHTVNSPQSTALIEWYENKPEGLERASPFLPHPR